MIRSSNISGEKSTRPFSLLWMILLFGIAIYAALSAWTYGDSYGQSATYVFGGISAMAALLLIFLWVTGPSRSRKYREMTAEDIFGLVTLHMREPCVLIQDGKPVRANAEYVELAREFGVVSQSDRPPDVDRIFSGMDKEAASAVFQLYHLDESGEMEEKPFSFHMKTEIENLN